MMRRLCIALMLVAGAAWGQDATYDVAGYRYFVWTNVVSTNWTPPFDIEAEVLVVAGGGGGGSAYNLTPRFAGGGGAGGAILTNITLNVSSNYAITVGAGGTGAPDAWEQGADGGPSSFAGVAATGGGGGGSTSSRDGRDGGSGGGAAYHGGVSSTGSGGTGIAGEGYDGASSTSSYSGGGGGAGAAAIEDAGGTGIEFGGVTYATGGDGTRSTVTANGANGAPGTGDGGGGSATGGTAGSGGSGIVIVRVEFPEDMAQRPFSPELAQTRQAFTTFSWNPPLDETVVPTNYTVHLGTVATNLTPAASTTSTSVLLDLRDYLPDYSPEAFWRVDVETETNTVTGAVVQFSYALSVIGDPNVVVDAGRADPRAMFSALWIVAVDPWFVFGDDIVVDFDPRFNVTFSGGTTVSTWTDRTGTYTGTVSAANITLDEADGCPAMKWNDAARFNLSPVIPKEVLTNATVIIIARRAEGQTFGIMGNNGFRPVFNLSTSQLDLTHWRRYTGTSASAGPENTVLNRSLVLSSLVGNEVQGGNQRILVNGEFFAAREDGNTHSMNDILYIGRSAGQDSTSGWLYRLMVINRVLTEAEEQYIHDYSRGLWGTP